MKRLMILAFVFILLFSMSPAFAEEKKYCDFDEVCEIKSFDVVNIGGNDFFATIGIFQEIEKLYEPYVVFKINGERFYPGRLEEGDKFSIQEGEIEGTIIKIEKIDWREEELPQVKFIVERDGCIGCKKNGECYPFDSVDAEMYCSQYEAFLPQLEKREYCEEDFQCLSGLCLESKCKSNSGISRFFRNIFSWF